MSQNAIANEPGQSTHKSSGHLDILWKKNWNNDFERHSHLSKSEQRSQHQKVDNRNAEEVLLSASPADIIAPVPIAKGMNRRYFLQQQQASNRATNESNKRGNRPNATTAIANPTFNLNNVVSMQNSNQNLSHPNAQQEHNAWLQHMILNPIHPLQNNPAGIGTNSGGNGSAVRSNQVNGFARQQQVQGISQAGNAADRAAHHQQQLFVQLDDARLGASPIASPLFKQQQMLTQPVIPSQAHQQQQGLHQLLPLNDIASQLQRPGGRQPQTLQQQPGLATPSSNHMAALPTSVSGSAPAPQQQQQQQLLLLALMLQQQNASNNNDTTVDTASLSTALVSTESLRLINSLLNGQQLPQVQDNRAQQQLQQDAQVPQGNRVASGLVGSGPAPSSSSLGVDSLAPSLLLPGIQEDGLSSHHQFFLSQQQQPQAPKQPQPQAQSQQLQLPPLSFFNQSMQSSVAHNGLGSNGDPFLRSAALQLPLSSPPDTISSLTMNADSISMLGGFKTSDDRGTGFPSLKSDKDSNSKANKTPTINSRFPRLLYCESDDAILGEYQTLLRQQLELFEADSHDVINGTFRQGRTTPIRLGQIGLRCKYCAKTPLSARTKGSVYFSQTIKGMYQIGQNMSKVHLCERCPRLPPDIKKRIVTLRSRRHRASGGRAYWIRHLREMGIYEDGTVLRANPPGVKDNKPRSGTKPASAPTTKK